MDPLLNDTYIPSAKVVSRNITERESRERAGREHLCLECEAAVESMGIIFFHAKARKCEIIGGGQQYAVWVETFSLQTFQEAPLRTSWVNDLTMGIVQPWSCCWETVLKLDFFPCGWRRKAKRRKKALLMYHVPRRWL